MLRLHFTPGDLMRVRLAGAPAPLMELGLSVAALQRTDRPELYGRWRRQQRGRLTSASAPLFRLVPPNGAGPLFLDPLTTTLDEGVETVMTSPPELVRSELTRVCPAYRPVTPWIRDLARRDGPTWRELETALRGGARALLDDWDRMKAAWYADAAWRASRLALDGVEAAVTDVFPGSTWAGTTLHVPWTHDAELHLTGRGVTLMPSTVWTGTPLFGTDVDGRTLLVHPTLTTLPVLGDRDLVDPVAALLGRTRAQVLRTLVEPRTTSQLATELRISLATSSQHASTLRAAGLVTSRREGRSVRHVATALGLQLLG